MIGEQVRRARQVKGWSLRRLARECPINPGYLSQIEHGHRLPSPKMAARLSDLLGVPLAVPTVDVEPAPAVVSVDTAAALADILAGQRRLEDSIGSAPLVAPTAAQLGVITGMVAEVAGPLRRDLLDVAAQWAVFTGWLRTTTGGHRRAGRAFAAAGDWALEAGDDTLLSHVYSFKGYAAGKQGNTAAMEGLTVAARRVGTVHPAQQAYNAFQHARALARLGETLKATRALDDALQASEAATREGEPPPYGYWYTPPFFTLSIGLTHAHLGNRHEATDMITTGLAELPPEQRTSEWVNEFRAALNTR